ncbi:MAG: alpha-ketoacid dehydrogenase subunit beta, partial [Deltaproteobacteria bacterium]
YAEAINEALHQLLGQDEGVVLIGQGVTSPWYVGTTTVGLMDKFGEERVIDAPVSENGVTGIAAGAALAGMRPVLVHPRMDFMYYAMDQIANHIANWYFMLGGKMTMPLVIWGIINRGGEQAAQHSQALQAMLLHIPGLRVVAPSNPYDAKGLLISAVMDDNPVVYIDDRWLYDLRGNVPEDVYSVPMGKGVILREGREVTVVGISYMVVEALKAAGDLIKEGIDAEVIDPRSLRPLDAELIFESVRKTGRLVITDGAWRTCGVAAEIASLVSENVIDSLKAPIKRVTLPDVPAPASRALEEVYYPKKKAIIQGIKDLMD